MFNNTKVPIGFEKLFHYKSGSEKKKLPSILKTVHTRSQYCLQKEFFPFHRKSKDFITEFQSFPMI